MSACMSIHLSACHNASHSRLLKCHDPPSRGILPHSVRFWCLTNSPYWMEWSLLQMDTWHHCFTGGYQFLLSLRLVFLVSITNLSISVQSSFFSFFIIGKRNISIVLFIPSFPLYIILLFACWLIHYWHWSFSLSVHSLSEILRCKGRGYGPNGSGTGEKMKQTTQTLNLLKEARQLRKKEKAKRKK